MTGQAFGGKQATKAEIVSLKARREIPLLFLSIKGDRSLENITVDVQDMGVGMLSTSYDIFDGFQTFVDGICSFQPKLQDKKLTITQMGEIVKIADRVIDQGMVAEGSVGSIGGRLTKGTAHAGMDEGAVHIIVASLAGLHAHVSYAGIEVPKPQIVSHFRTSSSFTIPKEKDNEQSQNSEPNDPVPGMPLMHY
jgi:hypothetical protein